MNLLLATGLMFLGFMALWLWSIKRQDVSIIDIYWGLAFLVLSWSYFCFNDSFSVSQIIPLTLLSLWGLRISLYLGIRKWKSSEDLRYQKIRAKYDNTYPIKSLWIVFLPQAFLVLIINAPVLLNLSFSREFHWLQAFGIVLFCIGFAWETIADYQLQQFKIKPENKGYVCNTGLWSTSQYPNYFGESVLWFGIFFSCLNHWSIALTSFSPFLITYLLIKVTGIPFKEPIMKNKVNYNVYSETTPLFIPRFLRCIR